ncbi:MAG TPA: glycosyltransferase family 2 protein [Thermodesulfobacteriota bacterium]|nr:glycosyltransferase family 2 protein [Thermodesulfobacteriota bacterium]
MPVFNEEGIIEKTVRDFYSEIVAPMPGSEMVIVDDCSTDKSPEILKKLTDELPCIRVLRPAMNGGHGKALRLAFENVKCDLIFHTDSDYQNDPKDYWKLYEEIEMCDFVIGYRAVRHDPLPRLVITRLVRLVNLVLFGFHIRDANSPFKLIRRDCLKECLKEINTEAFAPSILLAVTASWKGYRLKEVPVTHLPRRTGRVSIVRWRLIKVCFRTLREIYELRRRLSNSRGTES